MSPLPARPRVSVVLPTFDRLQYLQPAVESVLSQSFTDWELIVADDGSGPQVSSYLDTLERTAPIKVIRQPHQGNPGAVRNRALREAQGKYVAFLDSDDLWMPKKLEIQLAQLASAGARRWSYTEFIRIDRAGASIDAQRNPNRILHDGRIVTQLLKLTVGIAMPTVMVERELLERAGGFDEQQGLHEDYELWLRLSLLSEVTVVKQPLAYVRRHDQHFSSGGVRTFEARRRVLEKMRSLLTDPQDFAVLRDQQARNWLSLAFASASAGDRRGMWSALASGWTQSKRSAQWYLRAAHAVARSCAPIWLVSAIRQRRLPVAGGNQGNAAQ